jgi:hypothetical protein
MRERGQSSVEWIGVVLVVAVLLGVGGAGLRAAAGPKDGDVWLAARWAPSLALERGTVGVPVDPRECRVVACSVGARPVVFFHVSRRGGATYVQYWAYWPDSSWHGVAGRHADDWESFQVRIDADGTAWARASAHHGYTGHRIGPDLNVNQVRPQWVPARWRRGWVRWRGGWAIARHSHAGYVATAGGVRPELVELDPAALPQDYAIVPPWRKAVYADPESFAT